VLTCEDALISPATQPVILTTEPLIIAHQGRFDRIQAWGLLMAKPIWREGRITKNCRDCGAQTTGYVDTGKEPYALCINCANAKSLLIDQKAG
jgi:hypothetical protein